MTGLDIDLSLVWKETFQISIGWRSDSSFIQKKSIKWERKKKDKVIFGAVKEEKRCYEAWGQKARNTIKPERDACGNIFIRRVWLESTVHLSWQWFLGVPGVFRIDVQLCHPFTCSYQTPYQCLDRILSALQQEWWVLLETSGNMSGWELAQETGGHKLS